MIEMERSFELRNAIKVAICAEPSRDAQHHLAKIAASALLGNFTFATDGSDQFWRETRALLPPPLGPACRGLKIGVRPCWRA